MKTEVVEEKRISCFKYRTDWSGGISKLACHIFSGRVLLDWHKELFKISDSG